MKVTGGRKKLVFLLACTINAIVLIFLTFFWLKQTYLLEDEILLIRATSFAKKLIFTEKKPPLGRFLFVNVSWDKQLIEKLDDLGFPVGNQAITNREKLTNFFKIINKKKGAPEFIICDIFFKDPSPYDSLLEKEISGMDNILVSYHKHNEDDLKDLPDYPIIKGAVGLADYEHSAWDDLCLKFKLVQGDSLKTLPLLMYEKLHKTPLKEGTLFYYLGESPALNSFIIDYQIRSYDLFGNERLNLVNSVQNLYPLVNLGELLLLPDEAILEQIKNRIVVIGDFEDRDIKETLYGEMPGSLILLNTFLCLENKENLISKSFIVFLFLGFFLISYKCFSNQEPLQTPSVEEGILKKSRIKNFLLSLSGYLAFFAILSILCYFLFNIHLTILLLSFYMEGLERLKGIIKRKYLLEINL